MWDAFKGQMTDAVKEKLASLSIKMAQLSILKPLHAQWLVNVYYYFSTDNGREIVLKGWKKAGIQALFDGSIVLPPENPFEPTEYLYCSCPCVFWFTHSFIHKNR